MINDYDIEVKLLAFTRLGPEMESNIGIPGKPDSEELIEYSGRLCWNTADKIDTDAKRIQKWIEAGHESVIEHASATFYIRASRVLTHELVRHRLASYSQRSQRYVNESTKKFIKPAELNQVGKNEASEIFEKAMDEAWKAYQELLDIDIKPEIARYVLPNACETQVVMTMNFRELRHFIKLRTSEKALPEMRALANEIKRIMKEEAPKVFEDL